MSELLNPDLRAELPVEASAPSASDLAHLGGVGVSGVTDLVITDTLVDEVAQAEQLEAELEARFSPERLADLCDEFMEHGLDVNLKEQLNGRSFVVAYIHATSPFSDIGRAVETEVFSEAFKLSKAEVVNDYGGKYDEVSTFACVIDASGDRPLPVGALRIVEYKEGIGFKDVNDLLVDDPVENPWIGEIKAKHFADGEPYDEATAWQRLSEQAGVDLNLEDSLDIATHAAVGEYRGQHGDINGVSMLFYHACLRYAQVHGKKNLLAIFDLKPFDNLQQFGAPFDVHEGLEPHPYGGPGLTIPAYSVIETGVRRIRESDEFVGGIFIDGASLESDALMPNEYQPELYSNEALARQTTTAQ